MKGFVKAALAATLVAGVTAHHAHNHRHLHRREEPAAVVDKRDVVVTYTAYGPTETVYELDGKLISGDQAREGIANGAFRVVGESEPSVYKVEEVSTATHAGGQFYEQKATPSPSPSSTTTTAAPTTATPSPSSTKVASAASTSTATGLDAEFPDDLDCSVFPSAYGALPLDWMKMNGWSGIQKTPSYSVGDLSISLIVTGIRGDSCEKNSFCSYACPPGYQKTQWPTAQGSTKESIGGLYCNANGKLELTRPSVKTLCEPGVGGVTLVNDLDVQVSTCRTDYPGTEAMVVPLLSAPGSSNPLTNPDSTTYYVWDGQLTTAQYYVNKAGYGLSDSCVWISALDPDGAGNYSPMNIGVGRNAEGLTYISIFRNLPSSSALLDFNIEITGDDVNGKCSYVNGAFSGGGNGCTAAMKKGGSATIRYFK